MRILITNDDGINAPGLSVMEKIATDLVGPDGEVWTVAPAFEQSGVGHCISYTHPTMIAKLGERRFAAEGSPADCVLAGIHDVLNGEKPDLILSGVNRGNNSAENTMYSGTIGGAMEGALQGVPSFALSQYYGPRNLDLEDSFEASAHFGVDVIRKILAANMEDNQNYRLFYNINFPPIPANEVKGIKVATQGRRQGVNFAVKAETSPGRRRFLWVTGGDQSVPSGEGSDAQANLNDYISVTPMRADLTAHDALEALKVIE
ncbi:5'/3'-nucleotidase SurE [Cognatishimia activa]|uniref:5'-nucleotidase SurE n=1 Tax=Cognatishimia activa TaxID=1715691 RepID=A0A0N7MC30_9RHOB|nr:5'/3'-nucleotidase SurE [Cognatishimia activa]MEE2943917.1 5'/3'-nucleotidase SurE [Pseudomonadota bacterium]CUJ34631.1 5'-nucleotidase SurE [Cognatishimia activa]CUK27064.1 5'-nucleotidase SurE [Cognatishimia activa]